MGQWDEYNKTRYRDIAKYKEYKRTGKNPDEATLDKLAAIELEKKDQRKKRSKKKTGAIIKTAVDATLNTKRALENTALDDAKLNLYNFRYLMLENPKKGDYNPAPFHYRWSDHLINGKDNIAILGFRGCGKSEYVLRAFPLYCLVFPDESRDFLVILKYNNDQAEAVIKSIRKEYETSKLLQHNLVKIHESSARCFEAEVRDATGKHHRVRIVGYGKGSSVRGLRDVNRRPKVIIGDDIQDTSDFVGESTHIKDWSWFKTDVKHLGAEESRIFMIGNNLGERCIMERIKANKAELDFTFEVVPQADNNWLPTWKARDTQAKIIKERDNERKQGTLAYSEYLREKMCIAVNDSTRIFTSSMFNYYNNNEKDNILKRCSLYLLSDLASSTSSRSDYRVLLLLAVDERNNWFIIESPYGQWDTKTYCEKLFEMVSTYNLDKVHLERGQIMQSVRPFIKDEMEKRGTYFRIIELIPDKRKEERIALLQPRFEGGSIFFPRHAQWLPELEHELLSFTMEGSKSMHDDLIDTLAYGMKIAKPANPRALQRRTNGGRQSYPKRKVTI